MLVRSKELPRFQPPLMPIAMPMTADSTVAVQSSTTVGHDVVADHVPHRPGELGRVDAGGERVLQVVDELVADRLVEVPAQLAQLLAVHVAAAGVERDRVAGQQPEQEEVEDQDEEHACPTPVSTRRTAYRARPPDRRPARPARGGSAGGATSAGARVTARPPRPTRHRAPARRRTAREQEPADAQGRPAPPRERRWPPRCRRRRTPLRPSSLGRAAALRVLRGHRPDALVARGAVLEQQRPVRRRAAAGTR